MDPNVPPVDEFTPPGHHGLGVVFKSITLMVIICAGAIENAVIIYAVVKDRRLHRAPYYFVINLVIADLLRSVICLPFVQATVIHGSQWQYGSSACKLLAFASTFFIFGAVFALLVLALDRYISILHNHFHTRRLRGVVCLSIVLLGWGISFILAFPPVFGLGTYDFNPLEDQCTFEHRYFTNNDTLGFVAIFMATISLTLFLYGRIFLHLRKHRRMKPILCHPPRSQTWNFCRQPGGMALPGANPAGTAGAGMAVPGPHLGIQGAPIGLPTPASHQMPGHYIPLQQFNALPTGINQPPTPQQGNGNNNLFSAHELRPVANERLTRAVFIVTLSYDLIWMPYVIATCWYVFDADRTISYDFVTVATWLTYCQVALLPLVYILSHRPVRRHVLGTSSLEFGSQMDLPNPLLTVDT